MSVPTTALVDFSAWGFLSTPMDALLSKLGAHVAVAPTAEDDFLGGIVRQEWGLLVTVAHGMNPLEADLVARGLLAKWYGVDVADWPTQMRFVEQECAR